MDRALAGSASEGRARSLLATLRSSAASSSEARVIAPSESEGSTVGRRLGDNPTPRGGGDGVASEAAARPATPATQPAVTPLPLLLLRSLQERHRRSRDRIRAHAATEAAAAATAAAAAAKAAAKAAAVEAAAAVVASCGGAGTRR